MSDTIFIEFKNVKTTYTKGFLRGIISSIFPNTEVLKIEHSAGDKNLDETVDLLQKEGYLSFAIGTLSYGFGLHVRSGEEGTRVALSVGEWSIRKEQSMPRINDLIERCKRAYLCIHAGYGRGDSVLIFEKKDIDVNAPNLYRREVFWLNFYGPKIVSEIGTDRLKSVPYGKVEYLADGGVLFIRGRTPSENHQYSEVIREHLFGKRSLFDRLLRR